MPAGADGVLALPSLADGERTDPDLRGAITGLSLRHGRGVIARAMMEGVAFNIREQLDLIRAGGATVTELRVSGGDARLATWNQIKADVIGVPVVPVPGDAAVGGVAMLAGLGAGQYVDVDDAIRRCVRPRFADRARPSDPPPLRRALRRHGESWPRLASSGRRPDRCACSSASTPASRSSAGPAPMTGRRWSGIGSGFGSSSTASTCSIFPRLHSAWSPMPASCAPPSRATASSSLHVHRPRRVLGQPAARARRCRSGVGARVVPTGHRAHRHDRRTRDWRPRRVLLGPRLARSPSGGTSCGKACAARWANSRRTPVAPASSTSSSRTSPWLGSHRRWR